MTTGIATESKVGAQPGGRAAPSPPPVARRGRWRGYGHRSLSPAGRRAAPCAARAALPLADAVPPAVDCRRHRPGGPTFLGCRLEMRGPPPCARPASGGVPPPNKRPRLGPLSGAGRPFARLSAPPMRPASRGRLAGDLGRRASPCPAVPSGRGHLMPGHQVGRAGACPLAPSSFG
jgi:hypothetical protein